MLTKNAKSGKLRDKSDENFDLNKRFALSERLSMNFNVHMGNLDLEILNPDPINKKYFMSFQQ